MAGIYIHIPFCRQACHYCDFHFSTTLTLKAALVDAIVQEAHMRKDYLKGESISTIYFGGGTPSLLSKDELEIILQTIYSLHTVEEGAEITLEANPDDLTLDKLTELKRVGINRLSIGIQSFIEQDLRFMNRAHNAQQALACVKLAQQVGITNISIDLIYGTQTLDDLDWLDNIDTAIKLGVNHISAYALTVEGRTALANHIKTGKANPVDEEKSARHFYMLIDKLAAVGFEQYEISNFAKSGWRSKHNSSYWQGVKYLGLGPAAHSFNGKQRHFAVRNNPVYIKQIGQGLLPIEEETLSLADRYNEYVMTALRTIEGINFDYIDEKFGINYTDFCLYEAREAITDGDLVLNQNRLYIAKHARFMADGLASALFKIEE